MIQQYKHILVAVDGSDESDLAFAKAVNVAKRNQAKLFLAHIIDTRAFQSVSSFDDELASQATELAKQTLAELAEKAKRNGVANVVELVEYGAPKGILARQLPDEYDIDLIMVGATGLNAVERLLIGSVSEYIIRHAHCDVLVVRTDLANQRKK